LKILIFYFFNIVNEIKTIIVIIICVDGLLESIAACLIIAANVYCAGLSTFQPILGFNYAYLEIIGSIFLLVFALILLLIAGIVFYSIFVIFSLNFIPLIIYYHYNSEKVKA
jgi:hypothetical protein